MGSTKAYQCDGPGCDELTTREDGKRVVGHWLRVTVGFPDGEVETETGSFHDLACAVEFIEEHWRKSVAATHEPRGDALAEVV